ncbi:MAG TPA: hypothetical protein VMK82_00760 [Steroidobacteraceae bacterium]|nr:hypothetical protein [Steroidobacteraceae bacterium]
MQTRAAHNPCYTGYVLELSAMANLTLVIEDDLLLRARKRALDQGTSVNALVRNYLESYTGRVDAVETTRAFIARAAAYGARSKGPWTREELYDR